MSDLNLHDIVRGVVTFVHDDESITYYRNTGFKNVKGRISPTYAEPEVFKAQVQRESDLSLNHSNNTNSNTQTLKVFMYSPEEGYYFGMSRPFQRSGDMFQRWDGTWWLVTAVTDDFFNAGWVSLRAVLQVNGIEGVEA